MDLSPLHDSGNGQNVLQGSVRATADTDLVHLHTGKVGDQTDIFRAVRLRETRLQIVENDLQLPVVRSVVVRLQFAPRIFAPLRPQKLLRDFVTRKNRACHAQLRAHVRDRGPFRNGEGANSLPAVLDHPSDIPSRGQDFEHTQDNVLRGCPRLERTAQVDTENLRTGQIKSPAPHGDGDIQPSRSHRNHSETTAVRRVTVGTEKRFTRRAEPFQVDLMADAVARFGIESAVLRRDRFKIPVIVRVFEPVLNRVVIDIADGELGLHARYLHRLELKVRHRPGRVLCQGLVDPYSYRIAGRHLPFDEVVGNYFIYDTLSHLSPRLLPLLLRADLIENPVDRYGLRSFDRRAPRPVMNQLGTETEGP